jgi:hypothetical protein
VHRERGGSVSEACADSHVVLLPACPMRCVPPISLLDSKTSLVKLCDFGSAKCLVKGEPNVAYICSRYYRAPGQRRGATAGRNETGIRNIDAAG